jgi:hypothetical protein
MPAMIAASASNAAVVIAQRIRAPCFFKSLELLWQLQIADFALAKVHDRDTHSVFHFAFAETVQERSPVFVFFEILGDVF